MPRGPFSTSNAPQLRFHASVQWEKGSRLGALCLWSCFFEAVHLLAFSELHALRVSPFLTVGLDSRDGFCVFSQSWTCVYFLNWPPNLHRLSLFVLMDESELRTHLFGSSSLGREHRKTVLAYVCVLGGFFFSLFFCLSHSPWASQHLGPWQASMRGLRSHGEFYPVMVLNSRAGYSFPNPRLRGTRGITFLELALSYLSMFHSCKLEILPQLCCLLPLLPGKRSCGCLMALLSALLISPFHTV